jgi:hypothetical protein
MYTVGPAPPAISVESVARSVVVLVGADSIFTWMCGYFFSNIFKRTVRGSGVAVVIGLAHHVIVPLVALPGALAGLSALAAPAVPAAVPMQQSETTIVKARPTATAVECRALAARRKSLRVLVINSSTSLVCR